MAFMYHVCCTFFLVVCGIWKTSIKHIDADYSEYLGQDYKNTTKKPKSTSTIVSNHQCWLDAVVYIKMVRPAFSPSAEFRSLPLLSNMIDALDSIYIPRGGSEENKARALAAIRDRQVLIEETGTYAPVIIFAEGGTSNGKGIMNFKKGAFFSERTVTPMYIKYGYYQLCPSFDTIEFLPLAILTLSWFFFTCEVGILPDFTPNEHLFTQHADKGTERWEVYAWAVKNSMMKYGGFEDCQQTFREKLLYEKYMRMYPGAQDPLDIVSDLEVSPVI